ncbi:glycerol-3-phosphate responsive antiterminator [Blautia producta]|uniref:glycerol-3-phosphate responsive antiterminator n=1 Tax=Blautia sp. TaxID=1955243 RepID=UPI0011CC7289|nr:glycerol-3-phosphate responsive antiterminator [Blautia sp.]MBS6867852.1 glycerol-3-phosphate responsive antiterminator [Bacillota bacterium]NSG13516.1 glycerol-3-phosphate responsive antiterminator [Blautia producta]MEE0812090.1 glycerol-3-phosphate responsive antiterminator [Blautia sp.]NSG16929.1 glycerol-3-phosphate responsive antiterminator [Blautia producta]NSJ77100.1 glycerol-3-phosphate responsive antiterminator [Blautia producta]
MSHRCMEEFEDCPVIAAIKDEEGLRKCIHSEIQIVFVLYGDICSIGDIVSRLKKAGKTVMVHLDLITGLSSREIAVTYLKAVTHADGIISTKPAVIRQAKEEGLFAIMRFFVIDSIAFDSIERQTESVHPDMIEVLPGVMPKITRRICQNSRVPVIAGGLISDKEDIMAALSAGAVSISTTNQAVWFM